MNRFVVVNALPTRPKRQRPKFLQKFPKALCDRAALFKNMSIDSSARGNVKEQVAKPNPEIIVYTDDAFKVFEKLEDECSRLSETGATGAMWVRVAEHAKKIALINTIGDNKSEINAERAEYGCELMKVLTRNTCMDIKQNLADNEFEKHIESLDQLDAIAHPEKVKQKSKKKTRPIDPEAAKEKKRLNVKYLELKDTQGLDKDTCLDKLEKEFSQWTRSTIETYIKK